VPDEQTTLTISALGENERLSRTELKKMVRDAENENPSKADVIRIITPEGKRYNFAVDEL
jgi:ribosomal protein S24E